MQKGFFMVWYQKEFLNKTQNTKHIKECDYIKNKNFCMAEDTPHKGKGQKENACNKGSVSRVHKELLQIKKKMSNNAMEKIL